MKEPERQINMKKVLDKIKGFFGKVKEFFKNTFEICKDKTGKINWKMVWDHTTTVLLILVLSSPLFILAYIMGWFFTRQQL